MDTDIHLRVHIAKEGQRIVLKDDVISRQAVIEAVSYSIELCNRALDSMTLSSKDRFAVETERASLSALKEEIELMPAAEPDIITCADCRYAYTNMTEDGKYWCCYHEDFMRYCSDAQRREG